MIKLESKNMAATNSETTGSYGYKHRFNGVIHEFSQDCKNPRTFEMENTSFPVQLEYLIQALEWRKKAVNSLCMWCINPADRDAILKLPFAFGINMAHNKIEEILKNLNRKPCNRKDLNGRRNKIIYWVATSFGWH